MGGGGEAAGVVVFERSGETWIQREAFGRLGNGVGWETVSFGQSVALSADGNTALVAEENQSTNNNSLVSAWEATP